MATGLTQETNHKKQVKPMLETIQRNRVGQASKKMSKDSGYYSDSNGLPQQREGIVYC
jgi:hypothetical protein